MVWRRGRVRREDDPLKDMISILVLDVYGLGTIDQG